MQWLARSVMVESTRNRKPLPAHRAALTATIFLVLGSGCVPMLWAQRSDLQPAVKQVQPAQLGDTRNVHRCGQLFLAGQPTPDDISKLKQQGIQRVISLRMPQEVEWDEAGLLRKSGIEYISIPFSGVESLTDDVFDKVRKLLRESDQHPTMLHCGSANRVGATWLAYRVLDEGVPLDQAIEEAKQVGLRTPEYLERAKEYIQRHADERNVRPGINANFLDPEMDIQQWLGRFEIESREVFAHRQAIAQAAGIEPGNRVADVGAGTGFYSKLFAGIVGSQGWVFAVDISPKFAEHIVHQAEESGIDNLTVVLAPQKSISLPPDSVDVIFVCDTYHHFEYPVATLASMRRALRAGGTLVIVDFQRIPGKSSEWIMSHVRGGKSDFRREIEQAGFVFVDEPQVPGIKENYILRFRDPD